MIARRRSIVDAHHHLWDLEACHYPWLMARGVQRFFGDPTEIQRNYLVDELRRDAADYELLGSVHVQVGVAEGDDLAETAWLESTANAAGLPSAIVAYCDLTRPDAARRLEQHLAHTHVRGIRQIVGRSAEEDAATGSDRLLDDPVWLENLGLLPELGLSFDLQLIPSQAVRAAEVLARVPDLKVALCHCGSPGDQHVQNRKTWAEGISLLASLPNVACKLSGFGMFNHKWTLESIRPLVETCIEAFGPARAMFGSNFPVDKLYRSYNELWRAYEDIVIGFTASDQERLFAATARQFYRL